MAKFRVFQDAEYVIGHLRYGHREGIIEANSKEDALNKLKNEGYTDDLKFVLDDMILKMLNLKIILRLKKLNRRIYI